MEGGRVRLDGPAEEAVSAYLEQIQSMAGSAEDDPDRRVGDGSVRIVDVRVCSEDGRALTTVMGGDDVLLELEYESRRPGRPVGLRMNLYNESGAAVAAAHTRLTRPDLAPLGRRGVLRCRMNRLPLTTGTYRVSVAVLHGEETADYLPRAATLDVVASVFYPTGQALDSRKAAFLLDHAWDHEPDGAPLAARAVGEPSRG